MATVCPQLTQHRLTQPSASTAAGQVFMPGVWLVPGHSCAHVSLHTQLLCPAHAIYTLCIPHALGPEPFLSLCWATAHRDGPGQMSPPLRSYLLAPDSQFLLWDPLAWPVIHAQHMPQAVGLRCLSVCSPNCLTHRLVPQSPLFQRSVSNVLSSVFLFIHLTEPNPGPSRAPLTPSPVPPGEALMGGW